MPTPKRVDLDYLQLLYEERNLERNGKKQRDCHLKRYDLKRFRRSTYIQI